MSIEDFIVEERDEVLQNSVETEVPLGELYSNLIPSSRLKIIEKIGQGESPVNIHSFFNDIILYIK